MAVQTMNVVPIAGECIFVHLSEVDMKLAATAAWRSRKGRTVCNNCSFGGTAVDHIGAVCKACPWHPVTTEAGAYQSTLVFQRVLMLELYIL